MCLDDLNDHDVIFTRNFAQFSGSSPATRHFGRTTQTVYVDKVGRFFACEGEPLFNPHSGLKILRVLDENDLDLEAENPET